MYAWYLSPVFDGPTTVEMHFSKMAAKNGRWSSAPVRILWEGGGRKRMNTVVRIRTAGSRPDERFRWRKAHRRREREVRWLRGETQPAWSASRDCQPAGGDGGGACSGEPGGASAVSRFSPCSRGSWEVWWWMFVAWQPREIDRVSHQPALSHHPSSKHSALAAPALFHSSILHSYPLSLFVSRCLYSSSSLSLPVHSFPRRL